MGSDYKMPSKKVYKLDNFSYPSSDQGLDALLTKPGGSPEAKNWKKYMDPIKNLKKTNGSMANLEP